MTYTQSQLIDLVLRVFHDQILGKNPWGLQGWLHCLLCRLQVISCIQCTFVIYFIEANLELKKKKSSDLACIFIWYIFKVPDQSWEPVWLQVKVDRKVVTSVSNILLGQRKFRHLAFLLEAGQGNQFPIHWKFHLYFQWERTPQLPCHSTAGV